MKKYFDIKGSGIKKIWMELDYDLGGYSMLIGSFSARGYYLYAIPVERTTFNGRTSEISSVFKGSKMLLVPVARQSKRAAAKADKLAEQSMLEMARKAALAEGWELDLQEPVA